MRNFVLVFFYGNATGVINKNGVLALLETPQISGSQEVEQFYFQSRDL